MEDWQVRLQLEAQALLVIVESMKAGNYSRELEGLSLMYDEQAFYEISQEIFELARTIGAG